MSRQSAIRLATGMALLAVAHPLAAQDTASLSAAVDSASIAAGRVLYQGRGRCVPCHGERAEGTLDGPSLIAGPDAG
jgi:mono/diheme cytochrome c family protein